MGEKLSMTSILNGKSDGLWILKSDPQENSLK